MLVPIKSISCLLIQEMPENLLCNLKDSMENVFLYSFEKRTYIIWKVESLKLIKNSAVMLLETFFTSFRLSCCTV